VARITLEEAYPRIAFRPRTRNWWARLTRVPPECVHLETEHSWMATLIPDTLYLRGKAHRLAESSRPEVSLCRRCLADVLEAELASYTGRVIAFEPDAASVSQCFFLAAADFEAAGLKPEVAGAIERRLAQLDGACGQCSAPATWLWCSQQEVASLDDIGSIAAAPGSRFCPAHGAATFCSALQAMNEANLFYINVPYGEAGAYVWI
jgi:hypothetical protein